MGAGTSEVGEDGLLVTACFFEGVGQDHEAAGVEVPAGEVAVVVGGLGEGDDRGGGPGGIEGEGAEREGPEDVAE